MLGTDLPLNNPVRIAEEYSMLDNLLDGRLRIGMLRGTPNEYLTYGSNPWESRERYEEGSVLFIRCFTEPEPFGWEGRYYRYRNIAVWPQPVQRSAPAHPALRQQQGRRGSPASTASTSASRSSRPRSAPRTLAVYREAAAEAGWEPTADNILYRQFCLVAESDAEAQKIAEETGGRGPGLFAAGTPDS